MNKRDSVRVKHELPLGLSSVRPAEAARGVTRYWPSEDLAPFVEHYWIVRWDLAEPRGVETIPHPSVHIVLERDKSEIVGVMRTRFTRTLTGRGRVVGTKFWPGAFRPFVSSPVSTYTDRRLPLTEGFGPASGALGKRALRHDGDQPAIAVVERFLRGIRPRSEERMALAVRIAARIASDRGLTRVAQLVREFGIGLRGLERLFREYVGVSPKWVIQRYRLLEAADRVGTGRGVDWADLALDLGYADQAHFIRDFKRLTGKAPAEYARTAAR